MSKNAISAPLDEPHEGIRAVAGGLVVKVIGIQ